MSQGLDQSDKVEIKQRYEDKGDHMRIEDNAYDVENRVFD